MSTKYQYLKAGSWTSGQDNTMMTVSSNNSSLINDDTAGNGCITFIFIALVILVIALGFYLYAMKLG